MRSALVALALFLAAGSEPFAASLNYDGVSWKAKDAMAVKDGESILVAFAPFSFDRQAFASDGTVDRVDLVEGTPLEEPLLILEFDQEGILRFVSHRTQGGETSSQDDQLLASFTLDQFDAKTIAGKLQYSAGKDRIELSFELPLPKK